MNRVVHQWYENKKNVEEMIQWNKGNLKKWEQSVTDYFPKEAKILDIGCGMGREAFALSDMGFYDVDLLYGDSYKSSFLKECRRVLNERWSNKLLRS